MIATQSKVLGPRKTFFIPHDGIAQMPSGRGPRSKIAGTVVDDIDLDPLLAHMAELGFQELFLIVGRHDRDDFQLGLRHLGSLNSKRKRL